MTNWVRIGALDAIPKLGARQVKGTTHPDIAIFRTAEHRVFGLQDKCPHKGGPLSQGIVFDNRVACPLHNWTIALDSGCAQAPDEGCALSFPVKVEQGIVFLAPDAPVAAAKSAT